MHNDKDYLSILRRYWGYEDFRGIQRAIVESIGSGRDTLGLMPTGGGKSIAFQVPALAMEGVCIVVTPLISLMRDQVENLRRHGIKAAYITSYMDHETVLTILDNSIFKAYKFLYISPERLSSELFLNKLKRMEVSFVTVDEAHCICQWGYDFRPSYLGIAAIREFFPDRPVLALTATATPDVVEDIQQKLLFRQPNVLKMSFERKNLAYIVRREDSIQNGIVRALQSVDGSCIIYTRSRRKCYELAETLDSLGFSATYYHAGLPSIKKNENQERWRRGEKRVMVATNAFGMGIDKPDVRLVLHADIPDSIEAYFQEAGRAGRDGERALAILLTDGKERAKAANRLSRQFPEPAFVQDVYELLCCFLGIAIGDGQNVTREFNIEAFCTTYGYFPLTLLGTIDLLDKAGHIVYHDKDDASSRLRFNVPRDELFRSLDVGGQRLILAVLRRYGGIFVDYVYIDEDLICLDTGLTADEVYQTFLRLSQLRLVSFIPRKHLPRITFCHRRLDKEDISLPAAVYADRRRHCQERMEAMLRYAEEGCDECRSRILLRYFGEEQEEDCGICDVCASRAERKRPASADADAAFREHIRRQLAAGPCRPYELNLADFPPERLEAVIDAMRADGEISCEGMVLRAVE